MKPLRLNKVLGIALGERSLLVAEVVAGDRPEAKVLAEFVYPEGISPQNPEPLGDALGTFLRDNKFTAKSVVFGLPARWLVVKAKDVPPADPSMLANLLRLQAEGEFSSELKDLVYDYAADITSGNPKSVLLIATQKKYIDSINTICDAAKISLVMITASAVALGVVTSRSAEVKNPLVLLVSPAGAELTAQSGSASNAIRHLRGPGPDRPFVGELRRAISSMPPALNGSSSGSATGALPGAGAAKTARELVLWNAAGSSSFDTDTLGETLGMPIRTGDLPILGVTASSAASNGEGRKYAAAVSLALLAMSEETPTVDFLHSRLAATRAPRIPRWVSITVLATVAALSAALWAYTNLQSKQDALDALRAENVKNNDKVKQATQFVDKVAFAQAWHVTDPRYEACLADLARAIPADGQTYALSLSINETALPPDSTVAPGSASLPAAKQRDLTGRLEGKTSDHRKAFDLVSSLKKMSNVFPEVKLGDSRDVVSNKENEVSFSITFTYTPTGETR